MFQYEVSAGYTVLDAIIERLEETVKYFMEGNESAHDPKKRCYGFAPESPYLTELATFLGEDKDTLMKSVVNTDTDDYMPVLKVNIYSPFYRI